MIRTLETARLLSVIRDSSGLIGYRYAGELLYLYDYLDSLLVECLATPGETLVHSCGSVMDRDVLDRIRFFEKLPSIPFEVSPHGAPGLRENGRVLSPSTCYNTFAHLADEGDSWDLRTYTARGRCHRFEPADGEETRMAAFDMRELVLIGDPARVLDQCQQVFDQCIDLIGAVDDGLSVESASDVFYGTDSTTARKVQLALGVKREALLQWPNGTKVAVGSRNLHSDLFTKAFGIGNADPEPVMHSSCVAFGIDRLLLILLARTPGHSLDYLRQRLDVAADSRGLRRLPQPGLGN